MGLRAVSDWWTRYFTENAAVWLLRRMLALEWLAGTDSQVQSLNRQWQAATRAGDYERARELAAEIAQRLQVKPLNHEFWRASDRRRAVVLYGLALLVIGYYYLTGGSILATFWGNKTPLMVVLLLLNLLPLSFTSQINLIAREHAQGTSVFLRLTRLSGWDLLYGTYTVYALGGALRLYLIWGAPFLLTLATAAYESFWLGVGLLVRFGLCLVAMGVLWQTLMPFLVAQRATLLWQAAVYTLLVIAILGLLFGPGLAVSALEQNKQIDWFNEAPFWQWVVHPMFWASMAVAPLATVMAAYIPHPLWGVPQALATFGLTLLLAPAAARRLQRALDAPEPELKVQEGAWW